MTVDQIMTRDVKCVESDATLAQAAQLMWENDCGSVPVCDSRRRVIGMITDRDICMAAWTQGRPLQELRVNHVMAQQVVTCRPQDPLGRVETLMEQAQVRRLPIVDQDDRLVGIVSIGDIARANGGGSLGGKRPITADEVAQTLAAVSQPRT